MDDDPFADESAFAVFSGDSAAPVHKKRSREDGAPAEDGLTDGLLNMDDGAGRSKKEKIAEELEQIEQKEEMIRTK